MRLRRPLRPRKRKRKRAVSVDLEDIINNSGTYPLCESEVSDEGGYEINEQSGNINKQRFKNISNAVIDDIITRAETKKTKESTKWARRVFESEFFVVKI